VGEKSCISSRFFAPSGGDGALASPKRLREGKEAPEEAILKKKDLPEQVLFFNIQNSINRTYTFYL